MIRNPVGEHAAESPLVAVGRVVKPHGIRGEIRVISHADSPLLFDAVPCVWLAPPAGRPRRYEIAKWRRHKGMVLVLLAGVDDRDKAEALRGHELLVHADDLPDLDDGEVYLHEIVGLTVRTEDGSFSATIAGFVDTPEQETWVLEDDQGREVLFPAVEEFLGEVDLDAGVIVIRPPEGLLELYLTKGD